MRHVLAAHVTALALLAALASPGHAQAPLVPKPAVTSSFVDAASFPDGCFPADQAHVNVTVVGDRVSGPDVHARLDVVFLIDESGSMLGSDPEKIRRQTLINVLQQLTPQYHRASVVVFATEARALSPLTSNFAGLIAAVQALPDPEEGGLTNMAAAMALANDLLGTAGANTRLALLLTDGYPSSVASYGGYDVAQDDQITTLHVPNAIARGINYHVVHLLPPDASSDPGWYQATALMRDRIPRDTGGAYYTAQNAAQITELFRLIVETASHTLVVKNVALRLRFRVGPTQYTVLTDDGAITASPGLTVNATQAATGRLDTDPVAVLDDSRQLGLTSTLTAYDPFTGLALSEATIDLPCFTAEAQVTYDLGDGQPRSVTVPYVAVRWKRPPALLWRKTVEPNSQTLTLDVRSFLPAGEVAHDVRLYELTGGTIEPLVETMSPPPDRVFAYDVGNGAMPTFVYRFGDLARFESRSVSFQFRYFGAPTGRAATDFRKPLAYLFYRTDAGERKFLSSDDVQGAQWMNAALLHQATTPDRPNLYLANAKWPSGTTIDLGAPPAPISHLIWNDSAVNGWLPPAQFGYFVTSDPLVTHFHHRVWFRIANTGVLATDRPWHVRVSWAPDFAQDLNYFRTAPWKEIRTVDYNTPLLRGAAKVDYVEWVPEHVFSGPEMGQIVGQGFLYLKVETWYDKPELKLLDNVAVVRVPVVL